MTTPGIPILLLVLQAAAQALPDPGEARRLWLDALARYDRYDVEGALAGLRAARAQDPSYLPAHISYHTLMRHEARDAELAREYAARAAEGMVYACIAAAAAREAVRVERLLAVEAGYGPSACTSYYIAQFVRLREPAATWRPRAIAEARKAVAELPELGTAWLDLANALRTAGQLATAESTVRSGVAAVPDPGQRVRLHELHASLREARGDSSGARQIRRALGAALVRDGPPRPALRHLYQLQQASLYDPGVFEVMRREVEIAGAIEVPYREWSARYRMALSLVDQGRPREALPHYRRLTRITADLDNDTLRMKLYHRRGRAYAKLGDLVAAAADLEQAIVLAERLDERGLLADAFHDLAHVHESAGALTEAGRAIDQAVAIARADLDSLPIHIIGWRDAGMIRWKAGRHAAAHEAFRAMVAVIDRQGRDYSWAGEYFERIGDWRAAVRYYREGLQTDRAELGLNLAGLARSYARLGMPDSAEAAAREHDAVLVAPEAVPLMPALLGATGRWSEAVASAESWVRKRQAGGHVAGIAAAWLQLAEIRLDARQPGEALRAALVALRQARTANLPGIEVRALVSGGRAHLALGQSDRGLGLLRTAAALARAHPTQEVVLTSHLALGEALSGSAPAEALEALDLAAREVERSTELLALDFDRVRYRDTHLAPFDAALDVLLAHAERPGAAARLIEWSQRRSGAALRIASRAALGTGLPQGAGTAGPSPGAGLPGPAGPSTAAGPPGPALPPLPAGVEPIPLEELQAALAAGDAVLNYILRPEVLAVAVVRRDTAAILHLPLDSAEIGPLVARLYDPFDAVAGGWLDLARAPFDTAAARDLHAAVLEPLEPVLDGARRLLIVPDGILHRVPFDALVTEIAGDDGDRRVRFVLDSYETTYLPSLRALPAAGRTAGVGSGRILAVGGDAPGAGDEIGALREVWDPDRVVALLGAAATETAVRDVRDGFAVLHLATHGRGGEPGSQGAYLDLAPDGINDGAWHIDEIAAFTRNVPLVVLSACETMSGTLYGGEGLFGLARAFLASGAHAVIGTHWPVGEGTARLMEEFYSGLRASPDPGAALRQAKLRLRRDAATEHPFHWAAFVLVAGPGGSSPRAEEGEGRS